ncbi:MAG TPA: ATP-dependent DNA helicase RecG, partial [Anaerolineaceae bacterium]|nr:ATP-dependent DNA helicase RecG [Anaerolineaceae bacterium]
MQPSLEKLQKLFRLEAERGFDNRAVVGGLNKILPAWEADARLEHLTEDSIQAVSHCLNDYPNLAPEARGEALKTLWRSLQGENRGEIFKDAPRHKPAQPQPSRPPSHPVHAEDPKLPASKESGGEKHLPQPVSRSIKRAVDPGISENDQGNLGLNAPLTVLNGIGPKNAQILEDVGLKTLGDLLYYFPRRYDDYSQLKPIVRLWYGEEVTIIASVQSTTVRSVRGGQSQIVESVVSDGSGALRVTWFNQPWLASRLTAGTPIVLSGKIDQYLGRLVMNSPEWELLDQEHLNTNRIVPVYPLTARITQRWIRRMMNQTVTYWAHRVPDYLPSAVRNSAGLMDLPAALQNVHFPTSAEKLQASRERLAFDEIFLLQLGVLRQKQNWEQAVARVFSTPEEWLDAQVARLPYQLTQAQQRALADVKHDLTSGHPMNRLLQGDVGSGKTIVAALAAAMVTREGAQAAIMAPTGILAEQHYRTMLRVLAGAEESAEGNVLQPDQIRRLGGDTTAADNREIREGLESGQIKVIIGTHALIEAPVVFHDLQLVVVDEQHRFGVEQRGLLRAKGSNPHLLVMTATPIPRSLALTVYGDLDLSVMDEMPAGRQPVETHVLFPSERERANTLILSQVQQGYQAFIIYPLVEQGNNEETKAAVEEHRHLQEDIFPQLRLGLLHGRMKPEDKDDVMTRFRNGEYHILVSTSVVEVGVDVPNATVMVIEGANRFGLAQLHQFRGRVGRGSAQSFCLLIPETENEAENQRLTVMTETNDGFVLAEHDLEQRGPGEFLGNRQSGFSGLQLANLTDVRLIEKARKEAQAL